LFSEFNGKQASSHLTTNSLANISDVTIQIIANAQQNRQRNILTLVELTHCTGRNADIRAQLNLGYISLNEHNPELFVTNLHDSTPCFFKSLANKIAHELL
jgi:hypothetical protein